MALTSTQRERIITALLDDRGRYDGSDNQFSKMHGISGAVYSRLRAGDRESVVSDGKLITIGRSLNVDFGDGEQWRIVATETYNYITTQLGYCQQNSEARILVDMAGIGKTTAAREYRRNNKNVFFVDCSQVKTKRDFVRELGATVGVGQYGKVQDVIRDTIYSLKLMDRPIVILDEAGDLSYEAWLEIKRYWNALEGLCGWYMMGADGLRAKIESHLRSKKVGYAEIFDRFGHRFCTALPEQPQEQKVFLRNEAKLVAKANLTDCAKLAEVIDISLGLRRVKANVLKANRAA